VIVGPNFSTKRPIKAADIPKKKIAKLKAKETEVSAQPVCLTIGPVKMLQA
jgi:hypothetical protein